MEAFHAFLAILPNMMSFIFSSGLLILLSLPLSFYLVSDVAYHSLSFLLSMCRALNGGFKTKFLSSLYEIIYDAYAVLL